MWNQQLYYFIIIQSKGTKSLPVTLNTLRLTAGEPAPPLPVCTGEPAPPLPVWTGEPAPPLPVWTGELSPCGGADRWAAEDESSWSWSLGLLDWTSSSLKQTRGESSPGRLIRSPDQWSIDMSHLIQSHDTKLSGLLLHLLPLSTTPAPTFWSVIGLFPAGEEELTTHGHTAAHTPQEVDQRVVRGTHLRERQAGKHKHLRERHTGKHTHLRERHTGKHTHLRERHTGKQTHLRKTDR